MTFFLLILCSIAETSGDESDTGTNVSPTTANSSVIVIETTNEINVDGEYRQLLFSRSFFVLCTQ